jgi:hypothetical protein
MTIRNQVLGREEAVLISEEAEWTWGTTFRDELLPFTVPSSRTALPHDSHFPGGAAV